jgi:hypothetical protein
MKKYMLYCLVFASTVLFAQKTPVFEVKYSPMLSQLRYLEAAAKTSHYSVTYRSAILKNIKADEKILFQQIVEDFQRIKLNYNFQWEQYPESRHSYRTIYDLVNIAAVNSVDLDDFSRRLIGMIPNDDYIALLKVFERIKPFHDDLLKKYEDKTKKQIKNYVPYQEKLGYLFDKVSHFYGTDWNPKTPFVVCLYPIPGREGISSATPHGNTLVCGFWGDKENDYKSRLSVITHEMCHILYDGQSADNQSNIERWMNESKSPYRKLAYQYLDEGLATAVGNGWAFEEIHAFVDSSSWYADEIIDKYGHALFPLVKSYMRTGKTIDSIFIKEAIAVFEKEFPKSIYDYKVMANEVFITGSFPDQDLDKVMEIVADNFRSSSTSVSTPLMDEVVKADYMKPKTARLIFLNTALKENWEYLKKIDAVVAEKFEKVEGTPASKQYFSFLGSNNTAYLIVFYDDLTMLKKILEQVKKERYIEPLQALHELQDF